MNKLFIIGNGFDLAHGYKTRYVDFIYWYLNGIINTCEAIGRYEDELCKIENAGSFKNKLEYSDTFINDFRNRYNPKFKSEFFKNILNHASNSNWVDIEEMYFDSLKELYEAYSRHRNIKYVIQLNNCFIELKNKLVEYLIPIQRTEILSVGISDLIQTELVRQLPDSILPLRQNIFLNFNYTNLIKFYAKEDSRTKFTFINIHGELNSNKNPIIFGYGDEIIKEYQDIENANKNEFLKNIKSFGYLLTKNYSTLFNALESGEFDIFILGHSCGISDRVLLNNIFEHPNCGKIKIYYYDWGSGDDFTEKTQNISRHFKDKHKMRTKIIPKEDSFPLR